VRTVGAAGGVGARHGDQGLLKYTDVQNLAVLKKPVLGPKPGQDYAEYARQMLTGLKVMRRELAVRLGLGGRRGRRVQWDRRVLPGRLVRWGRLGRLLNSG